MTIMLFKLAYTDEIVTNNIHQYFLSLLKCNDKNIIHNEINYELYYIIS